MTRGHSWLTLWWRTWAHQVNKVRRPMLNDTSNECIYGYIFAPSKVFQPILVGNPCTLKILQRFSWHYSLRNTQAFLNSNFLKQKKKKKNKQNSHLFTTHDTKVLHLVTKQVFWNLIIFLFSKATSHWLNIFGWCVCDQRGTGSYRVDDR